MYSRLINNPFSFSAKENKNKNAKYGKNYLIVLIFSLKGVSQLERQKESSFLFKRELAETNFKGEWKSKEVKRVKEQLLIEHCSLTLANLKAGNLFRYFLESQEEIDEYLNYWNGQMNKKGVYLTIVKQCEETALIYVYRKSSLMQVLEREEIQNFLKRYGYEDFSIEGCITHLRKQFQRNCTFPHEIGVFLEYPLEDIVGFIENKGRNYKCVGCWKVYGDEKNAEKLFTKFKKCQCIYRQQYLSGRDIMKLTVAA